MQRTFENFAEWAIADGGTAEETAARQLEMFVDLLQQQTGGPLGYRLRRIILTNFWLYGQQEFEIPHGRLFLAGENASGKSTVLTVCAISYFTFLSFGQITNCCQLARQRFTDSISICWCNSSFLAKLPV